uniref:Uncharacterized protein n=1 Tax=Mus musculus TaxID=10090 RepID=Q8C4Q4_MOUSE|nr:unnamed protein product [Mus musculus]
MCLRGILRVLGLPSFASKEEQYDWTGEHRPRPRPTSLRGPQAPGFARLFCTSGCPPLALRLTTQVAYLFRAVQRGMLAASDVCCRIRSGLFPPEKESCQRLLESQETKQGEIRALLIPEACSS